MWKYEKKNQYSIGSFEWHNRCEKKNRNVDNDDDEKKKTKSNQIIHISILLSARSESIFFSYIKSLFHATVWYNESERWEVIGFAMNILPPTNLTWYWNMMPALASARASCVPCKYGTDESAKPCSKKYECDGMWRARCVASAST